MSELMIFRSTNFPPDEDINFFQGGKSSAVNSAPDNFSRAESKQILFSPLNNGRY